MIKPALFQKKILAWFDAHGRKDLPWQQNKTPYRVWVSEIMLQQTQVTTVINYYQRFIQQLPDLKTLAAASEDEVLHLWAGLGYYSRARHLHRAAKIIQQQFKSKFPDNLTDLQTLPGIGQSTAGAILAIAFNQQATILDGNVKRVLARLLGIKEAINTTAIEKQLWEYAQAYTPKKRVADYTQAMMDLGATLCVRGKPNCASCPLHQDCRAHNQKIAHLLPAKKSAKKLPVKKRTFLIFKHNEKILLCKRPAAGIWGGLWSFPEIEGPPEATLIKQFCQQFNLNHENQMGLDSFRHTFSHYHLDIHPVIIDIKHKCTKIMEADQYIWYDLQQPVLLGLPKPVQTLLAELT